MERAEGFVEKIVYRNEENGYTVLSLSSQENDEITCVGIFPSTPEGTYLEVEGELSVHPVYGEQIRVSAFRIKTPEDAPAMERYLASGVIKGIGATLAGRIVKKFGEDTFRIIEEEPERLSEVKGISDRKAREISEQFEEKRELRSAMVFLQGYGISNRLAVKIYEKYRDQMYEVMRENPYRLAEDISGVGFKTADEIAKNAGIAPDSEHRVKAGILYTLSEEIGAGNVFLPRDQLIEESAALLGVDPEITDRCLMDLVIARRVIVKERDGVPVIYLSLYYYMECNVARMLLDCNVEFDVTAEEIDRRLARVEKGEGITLEDEQRQAIITSALRGLTVITGGPGTGKTTTINTMIHFFENERMDVLLAAPTGRAAKRMTETTGHDAQTIHRLLEISSGIAEGEQRTGEVLRFERNEENPLEADVIIIDEVSMVDLTLMHSLLRAVLPGTRLVLVGDVNQLPSVGPGTVLADLIASGNFPVVRLSRIFRQAEQSDIIVNAHKINAGEPIVMDNHSKDFFLIESPEVLQIQRTTVALVTEKLPKYVGAKVQEIQVLTPMRKGELGVENLNRLLQRYVNPPADDKPEVTIGETTFRQGDKVMQTKNNYQLEWEVRGRHNLPIDAGTGVFNGDMGVLERINTFGEVLEVVFDDGKRVEYSYGDAQELELAYAVTVHKSQGSEYPAVVIPLLAGPKMLFYRNLLYTAVTRAKKCVTIVGSRQKVLEMIGNAGEQKRYSGLAEAIREMSE
ncbi:MAG: ATP-dependent RecD-like DNA helicase [Lachnospiraceae bacterium]|nr:ATP-dependent RecD-like DNA helicase [Lachnospiraceae bacterium]MBR0153869.1 ATP-dependent RecD-like DNA helicase [Lachnospiraceae bacterium]